MALLCGIKINGFNTDSCFVNFLGVLAINLLGAFALFTPGILPFI